MDIDRDSAGVRIPPPLVFLGTLLAGWALGWLIGQPGIPMLHGGGGRNLGWVAIFFGLAILLTANGLFRKAETDVRPWKRSSALVTEGVYRWTRNPMYLGMALTYAGVALVLHSLVALLLLVPLIIVLEREVIEAEEAYMEARFGDAYRDYKANVRRWI